MKYSENVNWMRAKIRKMVRKRLRKITKDPDAQMHWDTKYWTLVVKKYGVLVHNWPYNYAPFKDLSRGTSSLPRLEMLWLSWKIGRTYFREATAAELEQFSADGLFDRPTRAQRKDNGVVRGRRRDPATRSKRLKVKYFKTPATVPDGADD